jgi:hypothetical protein
MKRRNTMATQNESTIREKDSYYVLRHKPTGLYVHEHNSNFGNYDLEETSLLDNPDNQGGLGPFRIYPIVENSAVSALELPHGSDSNVVSQQVDQEARTVIDWLNHNDHYNAEADSKCDYEYTDFELMLVEVEYCVRDMQPVTAIV